MTTENTEPKFTVATALELIGKQYLSFIMLALDTVTRDLVKYRAQQTAQPVQQPAKPAEPKKTVASYIN